MILHCLNRPEVKETLQGSVGKKIISLYMYSNQYLRKLLFVRSDFPTNASHRYYQPNMSLTSILLLVKHVPHTDILGCVLVRGNTSHVRRSHRC